MIHGITDGEARGTHGTIRGTDGATLGITADIGDVGMIHGTTGDIGDGTTLGTTADIGADTHGTRTTQDGTEDSARIWDTARDMVMVRESEAADTSRRTRYMARARRRRSLTA